ncbi:iron uptake system protein EfeO [Actinomadura madurae]|uniref:iron uptake system protein EfeO n=1 Tax=Actinomadura madurae TaxID=1993 RepID=UPI0020D207AC|nr:iron uptake system protein EfeO [Actinomadura madurae]MCP9954669.1 iron uptake system protein EfeO [Actinomadura madurae]MCP9983896.1 iron uptake system protein EfeO [Actinomadura madurae]MCQ0004537.1 iron uptake system protein EfeO [Actinomadura madurae]MCQ0020127.1 iron uptake system protein EfeO [Actinomadura madurae]
MRPVSVLALAGAAAVSMSLLAACGGGGDEADAAGAIAVKATDDTCEVANTDLPAGKTTFKVTNEGSKVNEFEVLKPDGKILAERENIGPGTSVDFVVNLPAGQYRMLCSAGQTGKGPSQNVTVTGASAGGGDQRLDKAAADYKTFVIARLDDTLAKTRTFVDAVKAGDVPKAKELYAPSRVGWETIEPVAEKFGDIDPKVDAREADLKPEEKKDWSGWHLLEKALWKDGSVKGKEKYGDQLLKDLEVLKSRLPGLTLDPVNDMAGGAKELLDEVATGKVTGEEEAFSHTDLVDFKANVDGARKIYELLKPVVQERDAQLAGDLDANFAKVDALLKKHAKGDGYVSYDKVGKDDRKELADAVNALGEPLSKLAEAVAK